MKNILFEMEMLSVILVLCGTIVSSCKREELEMVQMIVRHGDVSPLMTYPEDPNPVTLWSEGLDDLTMLGKFQSYSMGYVMRLFYDEFITSNPSELEVISSTEKAIFKSAQAFATALYAPNSNWEIVQNFPYQPIYINTGSEIDKFLGRLECPAATQEYHKILKEESDKLFPLYEELISYWEEKSGKKLETIADIEDLYNCINTEAKYNLTVPSWAQSTFEHLQFFHDAAYPLKFKSDLLKRLKAGVFVNAIVDAMEKKISGEMNQTKVITYTTLGSHSAALMAALGVWDQKPPEPCATLLVELYRPQGEPLVRFLYLSVTSPKRPPYPINPLTLPGCPSEFCPLSLLRELARNATMEASLWEEECRK